MADAIDAVQRELGRDAIILHTRNYKVGGLFGIGGRAVVEVTASPASVVRERQSARPGGALGRVPGRRPTPVQPAEPRPSRPAPSAREERPAGTRAEPAPAPNSPEHRRALLERYTALASAGEPKSPPVAPPQMEIRGQIDPAPPGPTIEPAPEPGPRLRVRSSAVAQPSGQAAGDVGGELRSLRQLLGRMMHTQQAGPVSASAMGEPLSEMYVRMVEQEVDRDLADHIVSRVRLALTEDDLADEPTVRTALMGAFTDAVPVAVPSRGGRVDGPLVIALVGPTGVGKTTTIAKLAATYKLRRGQRVGLITTDTFRIAAVEQLRTYASIISVPLRVVMSPSEMASACRAMADCDVVLIDTAGRSPKDGQRVEELSAYLEAAQPHETHLVLSATASPSAMRNAAAGFAQAGPDRLLFTKLDEADSVGPVVSMVHALGLPLSFVTTGQEVPDHIEAGRADRLARMILSATREADAVPPRAGPSAAPRSQSAIAEAVV
jgi:flagellar biosynthesis protein FlhF